MLDLQLTGKVALITGGSKGIGLATATLLAREGANIAIVARGEAGLLQAGERIRAATGVEMLAIPADISLPGDCARAVAEVVRRFGRLDILINNAGTSMRGPFTELSDESWQTDLDLKLMGAVRCIRAAVPHMRAAGGGAVVNVTAIAGKAPAAGSAPTSVSRAAGLALTKALSRELAPYNIRVTAVCIGKIRSEQIERGWQRIAPELSWDDYSAEVGKSVPLGRIGTAEEAANVIAFLASGAASYVTGTSVNIDGGVCAVL